MLHRALWPYSIFLSLLCVEVNAEPTNLDLYAPLSAKEQSELRARIRAQTVLVSATKRSDPRFKTPGATPAQYQGFRLRRDLLVTSAWVATSDTSAIEIHWKGDGTTHPLAVSVDPRLGLAYLRMDSKSPGSAQDDREGVSAMKVVPGSVLYAVNSAGALGRYVILGPGEGQRQYFFRVFGGLLPGTPLFDPTGSLVSFVAYGPDFGGNESWILPSKAVSTFLEEVQRP